MKSLHQNSIYHERTHTILNVASRIVVIALLVSVRLAYADTQELSLIVLQKGTGDPVDGATVVNMQSNDYVTTNEDGHAIMVDIKPGINIKVLAQGYKTLVTGIVSITGVLKLYIEPVSYEAEGMEVLADRLPEKISKIDLTADELEHTPGSQGDPVIAAQTLPGVVAADDSGGLVYMRGSDVNDNIAVVNRIPIGYLYHIGGLRSTINPRLISDLNIFLGGFPVSYGDSLGGVFDIRLREPSTQKRKYYFDISTIESSFIVEGPVSKSNPVDSFYIAGRRSYIDLLFSPSDFTKLSANDKKSEEDTNQFTTVPRYYDVQGVYHHPTYNGSVDYYYFAAGDELAFENREGVKADPQSAGELWSATSYQTFGTTWKANLDNQWNIDMPLAFYNSTEDFKIGTDEQGNSFFANSDLYNLTWLPKLSWKYNQEDEISFGLDAGYYSIPLDLYSSRPPLEDDADFAITDLPKYRFSDTLHAQSISTYVQQRKHWNNKVTTTAGLRYDYISGTGEIHVDDTSPRVAIEYQATPATLYTASWGRYLQLPLGFELFDGFGNPTLKFMEAEHRIIGVEHKFSSLWSIKTEAYQKPMKNLVVPVDSEGPPNNYKNLGTGNAYGVDFYLKREFRNGRMGWFSYSYAKSERYNPLKPELGDRNFSGDQPNTFTAVWSQPFKDGPFEWMSGWDRWIWGIKLQAHSGKVYTPVQSVSTSINPDGSTRYIPNYGIQNSERTPLYYRADLRLEREILNNESKMKFYIDILNVTNHKNISGYDYGERFEKLSNPDEVTGVPFFPYVGFQLEY